MTHEAQHPLGKQENTDRDGSVRVEDPAVRRLERLDAERDSEIIGDSDDRLCPCLGRKRSEEDHDDPDGQKDSHDYQQVHHRGKQRAHRLGTQGLLQSGFTHLL